MSYFKFFQTQMPSQKFSFFRSNFSLRNFQFSELWSSYFLDQKNDLNFYVCPCFFSNISFKKIRSKALIVSSIFSIISFRPKIILLSINQKIVLIHCSKRKLCFRCIWKSDTSTVLQILTNADSLLSQIWFASHSTR